MEKLKLIREYLGFTQSELAWKLEVSRAYLSQIETGERKLSPKLEAKLRELLLVLALQKSRALMSKEKRGLETIEVVNRLKKLGKKGIGEQVRCKVAIFNLFNPKLDPIITNAVWALDLYHQEIGKIDIVALDDYNLDELIAML